MRAKGFMPSFADWWVEMSFKAAGAPPVCPVAPPSELIAWTLFDSVAMAVRDLENSLMKQSRQYARFRRCQNPNLVFADIKPPAVPGVDVLLQPLRATVVDVCEDESKLVLDACCDFHLDKPVMREGKPLQIIHHDTDATWVEDISHIRVGSVVSQTRMIGTHSDLAAEFVSAWAARWQRHADVPTQRWETIIAFAKAHLPPNAFSWNPMNAEELHQIIRLKKKSSAHGLDGVRLSDLQRMPATILNAFCDMFNTAEVKGEWPSQLISGKVVSLAKVPTPRSPSDFRPITVFGLLYRCWSSFHARKALKCLDHILPDTLYGSRQGCHASLLWTRLLWAIEWSYQNEVSLSGIVLDLQKAFNMLPRMAVFEIAAHVGLPTYMLLGWAGALSQMKRYFLIRQSLSEGVESTTGFPEGCGLSCVAMVLVDAVFHRWQEVFFPLCTVLTYVDDWQILCSHHSLISGAQQQLDRFVQAMDLVVDAKKSYTWSVSSEGRKQLRAQATPVKMSAKNLGAHVQFSKRHTNAALMDRVNGLQAIWPRLRLSACSYFSKIRALRVAAWPRALHAIASTTMSEAAFHSLRTGAMKGIDAEAAGANAWLHLGLIEHPCTDPHFWAIIETIRCIRECGDPDQVVPRLSSMAHGTSNLPSNGITATLLTRLQVLGWTVSSSGVLTDMFGSFSLFGECLSLLVFRAQWAWHMVVATNVNHRFGLRNLHWADPGDTRAWLRTLPPDDCRLFHKCLNGSHFTQDCKVHCQETGTDQCPFCMCSDSRFHRFWECEQFNHLRAEISEGMLKLIPQLPEFLTCYGWSLKPHTLFSWYRILSHIDVPVDVVLQPMCQDTHFFTDGSCMNQAFPQVRLATWAVVVTSSNSVCSQLVSSGPLPGILQSSYRAEIFAVWRALVAARNQTGRVFIWTDCNAVVLRLRRLLTGRSPRINGAHFDLWTLIHMKHCRIFRLARLVLPRLMHIKRLQMPAHPWKSGVFGTTRSLIKQLVEPSSYVLLSFGVFIPHMSRRFSHVNRFRGKSRQFCSRLAKL